MAKNFFKKVNFADSFEITQALPIMMAAFLLIPILYLLKATISVHDEQINFTKSELSGVTRIENEFSTLEKPFYEGSLSLKKKVREIGNDSNLILDPDLDSYHIANLIINSTTFEIHHLESLKNSPLNFEHSTRSLKDLFENDLPAQQKNIFTWSRSRNPAVQKNKELLNQAIEDEISLIQETLQSIDHTGAISDSQFHQAIRHIKSRTNLALGTLKLTLQERIDYYEGRKKTTVLFTTILCLISFAMVILIWSLNKRAKALLQDQRDRMLQSERMSSIGVLSSSFSHEIKNPLAIISSLARKISKKAPDTMIEKADLLKSAENISTMVDRIEKILNGMRNFSRADYDTNFETVNCQSLITDVEFMVKDHILKRGIQMKITPFDPNMTFEGRFVQVGQVLINLINNAGDAVENLEDKWIQVSVTDSPEFVEFSVVDSGRGVNPEIANKILEPFFTTKPVGKGTGLGLSISKTICEKHGGSLKIDFESPNTKFVAQIRKRNTSTATNSTPAAA